MAFNGSGLFNLVAGNPVVTGTTISSTWANNTLSDIATGLSSTITKDGQTTPTANIPMGGFKITGLAAPTTNGDALRFENIALLGSSIQAQTYTAFTTGGTSTAYTLTPTPAITAYTAGQSFWVTFNAASGAAPTLTISGVATPPNLVKQIADGTYANIAANDIPINHRSKVTLLSATQALVDIPVAAGKYITALPNLAAGGLPDASVLPADLAQPYTLGTAVAASGSGSVSFTSIPSWVNEINIICAGLSSNGTDNIYFQVGTSGGFVATGYLSGTSTLTNGSSIVTNDTLGFSLTSSAGVIATSVYNYTVTLRRINGNTWVANGSGHRSDSAVGYVVNGNIALGAALDRVRVANQASATFDAGTVNISYQG